MKSWNCGASWSSRYVDLGLHNIIYKEKEKVLRIIDVGCGNGSALITLADKLKSAGYDILKMGYDMKDRKQLLGEEFALSRAQNIPDYEDDRYDVCICLHMLNFVDYSQTINVLYRMKQLLHFYGILITDYDFINKPDDNMHDYRDAPIGIKNVLKRKFLTHGKLYIYRKNNSMLW